MGEFTFTSNNKIMNSIFDNDSVNIIDKYGIFYTRFKVIHSEF